MYARVGRTRARPSEHVAIRAYLRIASSKETAKYTLCDHGLATSWVALPRRVKVARPWNVALTRLTPSYRCPSTLANFAR